LYRVHFNELPSSRAAGKSPDFEFNARIAYESLECSDRAYMIYKSYDDQTDNVKTNLNKQQLKSDLKSRFCT